MNISNNSLLLIYLEHNHRQHFLLNIRFLQLQAMAPLIFLGIRVIPSLLLTSHSQLNNHFHLINIRCNFQICTCHHIKCLKCLKCLYQDIKFLKNKDTMDTHLMDMFLLCLQLELLTFKYLSKYILKFLKENLLKKEIFLKLKILLTTYYLQTCCLQNRK